MVSSAAHPYGSFDIDNLNCEKSYNGFFMYCNSKLCNILTAQYIAEKMKGEANGVVANSLHPGVVQTDIFRNVKTAWIRNFSANAVGFLFKNAEEGAQTTIHLAVSEEGGRVSGKYFVDLKVKRPGGGAATPGLAEAVWKRSEKFVKLAVDERPFRD